MAKKTPADDRFAYFNLLKFAGAFFIAVFLHYNDHLLPFLGMENPFAGNRVVWALTHNSYVFVEMYFIVSGVLFSVAYRQKIADGMGFDRFFLRRYARVLPLVAVTSFYMYAGNLLLMKYNDTLWSCGTTSVTELVFDVIFCGKAVFNTANTLNGPIWYISALLLCYAVAYPLAKTAKKHEAVLAFMLPVFIGVAIQYRGTSLPVLNRPVARGAITFFAGVILGEGLKIASGGVSLLPLFAPCL